jgi:Flp pilus assembly protein TadG
MLTKLNRLWRDRQGSALLEATVVTPFLCAICFGVYEFSWFFYKQHLVSTGVRDAARYLARTLDPTNPDAPSRPIMQSYAVAVPMAQNLAARGTIDTSGALRVTGWNPEDVTVDALTPIDNSSGTYYGEPTIYTVTVRTTFTPATLGLLGFFGLSAPSISVTHQERVIGPS